MIVPKTIRSEISIGMKSPVDRIAEIVYIRLRSNNVVSFRKSNLEICHFRLNTIAIGLRIT